MKRRTLLGTVPLVAALAACESASPDGSSPTVDATSYRLDPFVEGLDVPRAVRRVDDARLLVPDQAGVVHVHEEGRLRERPFLDLTSRLAQPSRTTPELGLAGLAIAPDFSRSGRCYVMRTCTPSERDPEGTSRVDVLSAFTADPTTLVADPASEEVLLRLPQTFADHVGGGVVVDDEGMLRVAVGADQGSEEAQDPRSWVGTTLRLDPGGSGDYSIPRDNPFVTSGGRREVWSYGYRNPFRLHWDDEVGLVVAHPLWTSGDQQVTVASAGANAGYPLVQLQQIRTCWTKGDLDAGCERQGTAKLDPPVAEYPSSIGDIISGAIIYRGTELAGLTDRVVVADWAGTLLSGRAHGPHWSIEPLTLQQGGTGRLWDLSTDGEDIFVHHTGFTSGRGTVHRLVRA